MLDDGDIVLNLNLDDRNFAVTVKNSGKILRELRADLDKTASGVTSVDRHFGSFSTSLRHTVMSLAAVRFAAMDFHDIFLRLPSSVLATSGEIEKLTKLMGGLSKETTLAARTAEAQSNTKYILDLAKKAPFEVKALSDAFVKMKSGGIDPMNGSMMALTDSVARFGGTSDTMHRAAVAIQQMAGKGVISMEELRQQLGEAVPTAMKMMAEGMGVSMSVLAKQVSLGAVESTDALQRMFTVMEFTNRGAAAEMMTTWTGMTSRLKTEWTLLQVAIGDSGFAEAAKTQISDLIKVIGSPQGMAMAKTFGKALADLVYTLRDTADWLKKNWDLITLLGSAMIAVFTAKKVLEFGAAMKATLKDIATSTAATARKYSEQRSGALAAAANIAQINAAAAATEAANNAAALVKQKAKFTALTAEHIAYLNKIRALEAANHAALANLGTGLASATAFNARRAEIAVLQTKAIATAAMVLKERELTAALGAATVAANANAIATGNIATAATAATVKVGLLGRAAIGLRVGVAALGGPIGIITTALMLGIPAWLEWGNSGEKAIKRIKDALENKTADQSTVDALTKSIEQKTARLAKLETPHKDAYNFPAANAAKAKEIVDLRASIVKDTQDRIAAMRISAQNIGSAKASIQNEAFTAEIDASVKLANKAKGDVETLYRDKLAALQKGSREYADTEKKAGLEIRQIIAAEGEAQYKIAARYKVRAQVAADHAKKGGNEGEIIAAAAHLDEVNKKLAEQSRFRDNAANLLTDPNTKVAKVKKPDALQQALEQAKADLEASKAKLDDLEDGVINFKRLRDAAAAIIEGDRKSGRFSNKDDLGNFVPPSATNSTVLKIADLKAQTDANNREIASQKALNRLKSLSKAELSMSVARFDNTFNEQQSTGVHKLQRSIEALRQTLVVTDDSVVKFQQHAAEIISTQAVADLNNFAATFVTANAAMKVSLENDPYAAKKAQYDLDIARLRSSLEVKKRAILTNTKLTADEVSAMTLQADSTLNENLKLRLETHLKDIRTPLQQLSIDWQQTTNRMRDASTRWANDTMDAMVQLVKGGKVQWKSLIDSILTDIIRIQLQKTVGRAMNGMFEKGINAVGGLMGAPGMGGGSDLPIDPLTGAVKTVSVMDTRATGALVQAVSGQKEIFKSANEKLGGMWDGLKTGISGVTSKLGTMMTSLGNGLSSVFTNLLGGLGMFMTSLMGGGGGKKGLGMEILDIFGTAVSGAMMFSGGGSGAATCGIGAASKGVLGATSNGASAAFGDIAGSMFKMKFADGGIMSKLGSLPLKRYSKGGIANRPQLAEFGEGSMNEAYVPLPDGRSIPVTMQGGGVGGGANVAISIVINEGDGGGEKEKSSGEDDAKSWTRMAQKIKTVVREEIIIQKRPGGALAR